MPSVERSARLVGENLDIELAQIRNKGLNSKRQVDIGEESCLISHSTFSTET